MLRIVAAVLLVVSCVGMVVSTGPELFLWFKSRSWQPAEASLLSVVPAAKTPAGVTEVRYRYEARGGLHESGRVYLSPRWMPGGESLAELEMRFMQAQRQDRPMRLWVSPEDPADAVFVRDLNWVAMSPVLGAAGVGMVLGLVGCLWPMRRGGGAVVEPGLAGDSAASQAASISASRSASLASPRNKEPAARETGAALAASPAPAAVTADPAQANPAYRLSLLQTGDTLQAELLGAEGRIQAVESATLDRVDAAGVLRWQDALPLEVLAHRDHWQVRCALPLTGEAVVQALQHPRDAWQVSFRVHMAGQVSKAVLTLPLEWWQGPR